MTLYKKPFDNIMGKGDGNNCTCKSKMQRAITERTILFWVFPGLAVSHGDLLSPSDELTEGKHHTFWGNSENFEGVQIKKYRGQENHDCSTLEKEKMLLSFLSYCFKKLTF